MLFWGRFLPSNYLYVSWTRDLFSLYVLFTPFQSWNDALNDYLFQISCYSCVFIQKVKLGIPLWPEMDEQNMLRRSILQLSCIERGSVEVKFLLLESRLEFHFSRLEEFIEDLAWKFCKMCYKVANNYIIIYVHICLILNE